MDSQWSKKTEKYTLYSLNIAIIGLIITIIGILVGAFIAIYNPEIRDRLGLNSNTNKPKPQEVSEQSSVSGEKITPNKFQNLVQPSKDSIELDFKGNWQGQLTYSSGALYLAQVNLSEDEKGGLTGQIIWSLQRTANPQKADKVNLIATEYVQGTFNKISKTLNLMGYNKYDPNNVGIILDKYIFNLSDDGLELNGSSYGGRLRGNFNLKRF